MAAGFPTNDREVGKARVKVVDGRYGLIPDVGVTDELRGGCCNPESVHPVYRRGDFLVVQIYCPLSKEANSGAASSD